MSFRQACAVRFHCAPGNQAGTWTTGSILVIVLLYDSQKNSQKGKVSARKAPGIVAMLNLSTPVSVILMNSPSSSSTLYPYVIRKPDVPVDLRKIESKLNVEHETGSPNLLTCRESDEGSDATRCRKPFTRSSNAPPGRGCHGCQRFGRQADAWPCGRVRMAATPRSDCIPR